MKLIFDDDFNSIGIILSERNLKALLHKLQMKGSVRTLISPEGFIVRSEPDDVHYADRDPGIMHPETEDAIINWRSIFMGLEGGR